MWRILLERWNLDAALAGLVVGALAAATGHRRRWSPEVVAAAAILAAVAVLVVQLRAPWWLLVALAVAVGVRGLRGTEAVRIRACATADVAAALAVVAASRVTTGSWPVVVAAAAVALGCRWVAAPLPGFAVAAVSGAAAVGVWLCAPDTERVLVVGGALVVPLLASGLAERPAPAARVASPAVVASLAVVWTGARDLTVRPEALAVLLVVAASLAAPALAAAPAGAPRARATAVATVVGGIVVAGSARTIGLGTGPDPATPLAVALALPVGCAWWVVGRRARDPS